MAGFIKPPIPELRFSALYKCQDCGHKFSLLSGFVSKKCPRCDGTNVKTTFGLTKEKNPFDDIVCW